MRQAHGGGQPGVFMDFLLDAASDLFPAAEQPETARDVEERLIEGQALHPGGEFAENPENFGGFFAVTGHPGPNVASVRAKPARPAHRQGRVDAQFARLVTCGGNYAARPKSTDNHGFTDQRRVVQALHRGIERVHVHVNDGPLRNLVHLFPYPPGVGFAREG